MRASSLLIPTLVLLAPAVAGESSRQATLYKTRNADAARAMSITSGTTASRSR